MNGKLHICMVGSGTGHWDVYRGRTFRLIGKNNTFRTFEGACGYAYLAHQLRRVEAQVEAQISQQDSFHTTRRA